MRECRPRQHLSSNRCWPHKARALSSIETQFAIVYSARTLVIHAVNRFLIRSDTPRQIRIEAAKLLDPPPTPVAYPLYDDATPGATATEGITGFVEIHIRASFLPEWVRADLPKPMAIASPPMDQVGC